MSSRELISFDWAMKRLLRNKANFGILNGFLTELIKDEISVQHILESESNRENERDKSNRLDLLCVNQKDELIAIEIQYYVEPDYFHRCLFGVSKIITEYLSKGDPYSLVKKVYSINILYFDLGMGIDYVYIGRTNFVGMHHSDTLMLSEKQVKMFDKKEPSGIFPEYYLLKINKFDNLAKNTLDEWIYFLKNTKLPKNYKAKGLQLVNNQLRYDNMDAATKLKYKKYQKNLLVSKDMLENAWETGLLEGEAKGEARGIIKGKAKGKIEGMIEGKIEGKIEIVLKCYAKGIDIITISNITGFSEDEIKDILNKNYPNGEWRFEN